MSRWSSNKEGAMKKLVLVGFLCWLGLAGNAGAQEAV